MYWNDKFEYRDGNIYWLYKPNRNVPLGAKAGTVRKNGYCQVCVDKKLHYVHRIIWEMHYGKIPDGLFIDHINHDRSDNRIDNLRVVTHSQNHFNRKAETRGYIKRNGKYVARLGLNHTSIHLGTFDTPEEATNAYRAARDVYNTITHMALQAEAEEQKRNDMKFHSEVD